MAFPDGWLHRIPIDILPDQVDGDLTDWTLYITDAFGPFFGGVNGPLDADGDRPSEQGGGDVRFSSDLAGQTRLGLDIRRWVTDADPVNGEFELAVLVPFVSSSQRTTIYMWWGKSGETQPAPDEPFGRHAAYNSGQLLALPLGNVIPDGSPDDIEDRTSHALHFTSLGMGQASVVSGPNGFKALSFGAAGTRLFRTTVAPFNMATNFSVTAITHLRATLANYAMFSCLRFASGQDNAGYRLRYSAGSLAHQYLHLADGVQVASYQDADTVDYHQVTGVHIIGFAALAFDGEVRNTVAAPDALTDVVTGPTVGAAEGGDQELQGEIAEISVWDATEAEDSIKAHHFNILDPDEIFDLGGVVDFDHLTSVSFVTSPPVVGIAVLSQDHPFVAESFVTGEPGFSPVPILGSAFFTRCKSPFPDVSGALRGWTNRTGVRIITKEVQSHKVVETAIRTQANMILQPMPSQQVNRKPTEQRSWRWWSLWVDCEFQRLEVDTVIVMDGISYRIEKVDDWQQGGFRHYEAVEDYTPIPG